jgi:hypothetical protein
MWGASQALASAAHKAKGVPISWRGLHGMDQEWHNAGKAREMTHL